MSVYIENGYKSRRDYLVSLAVDYGVEEQTVFYLASFLGKEEDFDALVQAVEDIVDSEDCWGERSFVAPEA